ncbi:MAG: DedA family protein [candidate division Zixibacteria bacterium]|jgi:membrane protein DedA with SNARE-associated domain|nr:DedA family protein [candidate division Zixibacteria bacterium]
MTESFDQIQKYIDYLFAYGPVWVYMAIFAASFIENIIPPFPGDTFIFVGGALVAFGRLDLNWLMVLVNTGGMASVMLLYYLGRKHGREYFIRKNYRYFSADDVYRMSDRLRRHGAWILVFSRFVVGLRTALALSAGIGRYSMARTLVFSLISYLLFTSLLVYVAITMVNNVHLIERYVRAYNWIVWPALILLVGIYIFRRYKKLKGRKETTG